MLAEFAGDMDDFAAEIDTPPPPAPTAPFPTNPKMSPPVPVTAGGPVKPGTSRAAENRLHHPRRQNRLPNRCEYANEYRVTCKTCGSFMYSKASQAGKTVKCSDCHSPRSGSRLRQRSRRSSKSTWMKRSRSRLKRIRRAERRPDPYQKSANELLEEAERVEDTNQNPTDYDRHTERGRMAQGGLLCHSRTWVYLPTCWACSYWAAFQR